MHNECRVESLLGSESIVNLIVKYQFLGFNLRPSASSSTHLQFHDNPGARIPE